MMLQATRADLLSIWSVGQLGTKYANAYALPDDEKGTDRRLSTFENLADTWSTPEVMPWHKHMGDFWDPVILYLRRNRSWMPLHEAFLTGWDHGFRPKSEEEVRGAWARPYCDGLPDTEKIFNTFVETLRQAYAHDDFPVDNELWRSITIDDHEKQMQFPLDLPDTEQVQSSPSH
jgi:hypothetical protein